MQNEALQGAGCAFAKENERVQNLEDDNESLKYPVIELGKVCEHNK